MAGYSLIASYATVQVLSPTLVNDIVYTTIQTSPSGVIASLPVQKAEFDAGTMRPLLTSYADNIEQLMGMPGVIAGRGEQTLDDNGLLADNVIFTVEYTPPGTSGTSVTAEATVPNGLLSEGGDPQINSILIQQAEAIITQVYDHLKAASSG